MSEKHGFRVKVEDRGTKTVPVRCALTGQTVGSTPVRDVSVTVEYVKPESSHAAFRAGWDNIIFESGGDHTQN